jgi:hypothetical protein
LAQVCFGFLVDVAGLLIAFKTGNAWFYNCYFLIDIIIVNYAATLLLKQTSRKTVLIGLAVVVSAWLLSFRLYGITTLFNWAFLLGSILTVYAYLAVLFSLLNADKSARPVALIVIGNLLYYACCIPCFGFINYLMVKNPKLATDVFHINHVFSTLRYILIGFSFLTYRKLKTANTLDR